MTEPDAEADLWRFALKVYGADGVSADCLTLQERYGVDVPVVLCGLWMATRGIALDAPGMARIAGAVEPWHKEVVIALRTVRQRLKNGPPPAPDARTDAVREAVKAAELNAERIELAVLAALVADGFTPGAPVSAAQNLKAALEHYAGGPVGKDAPLQRLISATELAL
ncbi:TIGR02444 family protein [Cognatishimia sp. F0-27]|uniref:TIGR02444 family protein n=1 Tax=Cognatishimia sp. F0-27 TaxID=2816855 RepID=UPI001D0C6E2A|nr:TIGR02444 family protein [Cognatishimia sp. F0-27]